MNNNKTIIIHVRNAILGYFHMICRGHVEQCVDHWGSYYQLFMCWMLLLMRISLFIYLAISRYREIFETDFTHLSCAGWFVNEFFVHFLLTELKCQVKRNMVQSCHWMVWAVFMWKCVPRKISNNEDLLVYHNELSYYTTLK